MLLLLSLSLCNKPSTHTERTFSVQEQELLQTVGRGRRKSSRPDAVPVGLGRVRAGGGAERQGLGARLPPPDDGAQRAGHLQGVPGEGARVGAGAETPEDGPREPAEGERPEGDEAGADAHDADVPAAAGEEEVVRRGPEGQLSERQVAAGSERSQGEAGGDRVGTLPEDRGDIAAEVAA